jgi:hypothetical protein
MAAGVSYPTATGVYIGNCGQYSIAFFPNPAEEYIDIKVEMNLEENSHTESSSTSMPGLVDKDLAITIFNDLMRPVLKSAISRKGGRIDVRDIPKGSYILQIDDRSQITTKHILIN